MFLFVFLIGYIVFLIIMFYKMRQAQMFYIKNGTYMEVPLISYTETVGKRLSRFYHITVRIPETEESLTLVTGLFTAEKYQNPGDLVPIYYVPADVIPPDKHLTRIRFADDVSNKKVNAVVYIGSLTLLVVFSIIFMYETGVFS